MASLELASSAAADRRDQFTIFEREHLADFAADGIQVTREDLQQPRSP
jgi:hypothetical protein